MLLISFYIIMILNKLTYVVLDWYGLFVSYIYWLIVHHSIDALMILRSITASSIYVFVEDTPGFNNTVSKEYRHIDF